MPIAERGILGLKCVSGTDNPVDLLILRWPIGQDNFFLAIPLRVSTQGIILALPGPAIAADILEEANEGPDVGLLGPNLTMPVQAQGVDEEHLLDVLFVEFRMDIRKQLDRRTPNTRRTLIGFEANLEVLPSFWELNDQVEAWLESGGDRLEEYHTAPEGEGAPAPTLDAASVLQQLQAMQSSMDRRFEDLENRLLQQRTASPSPPPRRGSIVEGLEEEPLDGLRKKRVDAALLAAKSQLGRAPKKTGDEPGRGAETAVDAGLLAHAVGSGASAGDALQLATLKLLQDMQGKASRKKGKKLPGLPNWEEDGSSEEEDTNWSSSSKGGRGIEAVERLRLAMQSHPEAYQARMEARMLKAVEADVMNPSVPMLFAKSCPVGKSRTAGYCLQGFAATYKLLLEGREKQARLQVLKMLAAIEQFLIDESWTVGSRLTGLEEPPWGHWATQDLGALRRQYVYTRLAESTWVAALINELKEEEWLAKKRGNVNTNKGKGKGEGKDIKDPAV